MTSDEFYVVLDKVINHCEYVYLHVVGEPLLHPELDKILSFCDQRNAKIKLTTNGTLLKKNLDLLTAHSSLKTVNISLSCIKDFDYFTVQNYLEETFFAAKHLSQNKITTVLRVWTDIKHSSTVQKKMQTDFNADVSLTAEGFQKIGSYLLFNVEKEFIWPVKSETAPTRQNSCLGLRKQLAVLSDGTVVPCCLDSDGKLKLGNIFLSTLEEIVTCERAEKIAEGFRCSQAVEPFCQTCTFSKKFD